MTASTARQRGDHAERLACDWLSHRGFRILDRNFSWRGGELDIVGWMENEVVFVEVRYRSREDFGGSVASINRAKRLRVKKSAQRWLLQHPEIDAPCRFDVIAIDGNLKVQWLQAAFE